MFGINQDESCCNSTRFEFKTVTFPCPHKSNIIFSTNSNLLRRLIGERKIIISERKSPNMASLTFAKSIFSTVKFGSPKCKSCQLMNVLRNIILFSKSVGGKDTNVHTCLHNCTLFFLGLFGTHPPQDVRKYPLYF